MGRPARSGLAVAALGLLALGFVARPRAFLLALAERLAFGDAAAASIVATNKYSAAHGHAGADYPWLETGKLVEPHVATTLTFEGVTAAYDASRTSWRVDARATTSGAGVVSAAASPVSATALFTAVGTYDVTSVLALTTGGELALGDTVTCRYVRREIRTLDQADRTAFFAAVEVLVKTRDGPGRATYGDEWRGMDHYVALHLANAVPNMREDHFHDGMGFVSQHVAITADFELGLQVVNPAVSVPYWDYTLDWTLANGTDAAHPERALWDLELWSDAFFGNASGSALHTVETGRWAFTKVASVGDVVDANYPGTWAKNPYGVLRAPWNLNPSPYVTRYHKQCGHRIEASNWPTCETHRALVYDTETLADFVPYAAYTAHAGVHLMIGGSAGCESWAELEGLVGADNVKSFYFQSSFLLRNVYRFGLCAPPESCAFDAADNCTLECRGCDDPAAMSPWQLSQYEQWFPDVERDPFMREAVVRKLVCGASWRVGDHVEASSPADISFWPAHPTIERLLQYKFLAAPFADLSWNATGNAYGWNDLCKWGADFDQAVDCAGHRADDLTAFFVKTQKGNGTYAKARLSNEEILNRETQAGTEKLSYVYDNFNWAHCDNFD